MKRWPSLTLFTAILFGLWLLLNDSATPGQIALAVLLTVATGCLDRKDPSAAGTPASSADRSRTVFRCTDRYSPLQHYCRAGYSRGE